MNAAMEPAEGAGGLASKAKDEVAETVATIGEAHVHEEDVVVASLMGIFDGMPDGELGRMIEDEALTKEG